MSNSEVYVWQPNDDVIVKVDQKLHVTQHLPAQVILPEQAFVSGLTYMAVKNSCSGNESMRSCTQGNFSKQLNTLQAMALLSPLCTEKGKKA